MESGLGSLRYILSKDDGPGDPHSNYNLLFWYDNKLALFLYGLSANGAPTKGTDYWNTGGGGIIGETPVLADGWHHVAGVYTGTELRVYVDNTLDGAVPVTGTPHTNSAELWIGNRKYAPGWFAGRIDEVRISSIAITSFDLTQAPTVDPANTAALWHFDESTGSTAYDETTNDNDGTIYGDAKWAGPIWTTAIFGKALSFDGVDDHVTVPDSLSLRLPSTELTIEAWIQFPSASLGLQLEIRKWIDADGGWASYVLGKTADNKIYGAVQSKSLGQYPTWITAQTVSALGIEDTWAHIAFTWKKGAPVGAADGRIFVDGVSVSTTFSPQSYASSFVIDYGNYPLYFARKVDAWPSNYFKGLIDEARIWSRALSAEEIKAHAWGLLGEWRFDEDISSGTTVYDTSGFGNDGTIAGATRVAGRLGNALSFDGDDYVQIANEAHFDFSSGSITLEAWIKPTAILIPKYYYELIIAKGRDGLHRNFFFGVLGQTATTGKLVFMYKPSSVLHQIETIEAPITEGEWHHVAVTYTFGVGSSAKLYVNGEEKSTSWTFGNGNEAPTTNDYNVRIGSEYYSAPNEFFNGLIDEVRVWNQALIPITIEQTGLDNAAAGELVVTLADPIDLYYEDLPYVMMVQTSTEITLTAHDIDGFTFLGWDVDGTPQDTENPITIHMDEPHTATANYFKWLTVSGHKYEECGVFCDSFDDTPTGSDPSGWTEHGVGTWIVEKDATAPSQGPAGYGDVYSGFASSTTYTRDFSFITVASDFSNGVFEFKFKLLTDGTATPRITIPTRYQDDDNWILFDVDTGVFRTGYYIFVSKWPGPGWVQLAGKNFAITKNVWHSMRIVLDGWNYEMWIDGVRELTAYDTVQAFSSGEIGLGVYRNTHAHFDDVCVSNPLEDWTINLYKDSIPYDSTTTDENGYYEITVMEPGTYHIKEMLQAGWTATSPTYDPGPGPKEVEGYTFTAESGVDVTGKDFWNFEWLTVSGHKFFDADDDGIREVDRDGWDNPGEPGLEHWLIELYKDSAFIDSKTTDSDGYYEFTVKDPGTYTVSEELLGDCLPWEQTAPEPLPPGTHTFDAVSGEDVEVDFGNWLGPSIVTTTGYCWFDMNPTTTATREFKLIFTPDVPDNPTEYKLTASNPGQFMYNIFYVGELTEDFVITLPYPFVTQGAMPVHVYSSLNTDPNGCLIPGDDITYLFETDPPEPIDPLAPMIDTITVSLKEGETYSGFVYITVHADYGLKKTGSYDNTFPIETYNFEVSFPDASSDTDTIENLNVFKHDPGFGGLVTDSSGNPVQSVKVQIYGPDGKLLATVYTNEDGWYMYNYKYTGKPATFTVKLPDYVLQQSVTVKANSLVIVNFQIP